MAPTTAQAPATSQTDAKWPLTFSRRRWLTSQVERWAKAQLISPQLGKAIASHYLDEATLRRQWVSRGVVVLCSIAAVMLAAGCLLLLTHNWPRISRYDRTVVLVGGVALVFAGSIVAYQRERQVAGEVLALLGTLLFGASIWLLALTYHIQSHYPEGFFWWMAGTMVTATLLKSPLCAVAAVALSAAWTGTEILEFQQPNYLFLVFSALSFVLAYWQRSRVVLLLSQVALTFWLLATATVIWRLDKQALYLLGVIGAAYFAIGLATGPGRPSARLWQMVGIAAVLAGMVGPSYLRFHEFHHYWLEPAVTPPIIALGLALLVVVVGYIGGGMPALRWDWPPLACAAPSGAAMVWWLVTSRTEALWTQHDPLVSWWLTVAFNGAMLGMGVWLVVRGVRSARGMSFVAGVMYLLLLVSLRHIDFFGDRVSSAVLFFSAGVALLITAYFWSKRHRLPAYAREIAHG